MIRGATLLTAMAVLARPCPGYAQEAENQSSGTVSSHGQSGGQTAHIINNYGAQRNPQRQALSAVMIRFNSQMQTILEPFRSDNAYLVLYDPTDPFFHVNGVPGKSYDFYVGDADFIGLFPESTDRCVFQDGLFMIGMEYTLRIGTQMDVSGEAMSLDNPLFQLICDTIGGDASESWRGPSQLANSQARPMVTHYDMLSRGARTRLMIRFLPGDLRGAPFEQRNAREYWGGAFMDVDWTQTDSALRNLVEPQLGRVGTAQIQSQAEETGSIAFSLNYAAFLDANGFEGVAERARGYFGPQFTEMDAAWLRFLDRTTLPVAANARPIVVNGRFAKLLERFRLRDVGSSRFWLHLPDGSQYLQSLTCSAAIFAVSNDYAAPAELPRYAECVGSQRTR